MLFVYKLTKFFVKLFFKVLLLPVRLLGKLLGSDAAAGMAGGVADSLTDDGEAGESAGRQSREAPTQARGGPESVGLVNTLSRVWAFTAQRPELFLPALALGGVRAVLVSPSSAPTEVEPASLLGSLLVMVGGLWVGGMVAHGVADPLRGQERDMKALAEAAISGLPYAIGVTLLIVVGVSVIAGLFGVVAVATGPIALLAVLPALYLLLRASLAVPAVFLSTRGVVEAIRESWRRSSGNVLTLAALALVAGLATTFTLLGTLGTVAATTLGTPLWMASATYVYVGAGGAVEPGGATATTSSRSGRSGSSGGSRDTGRSGGGEPAAWNRPDADDTGQTADAGSDRTTATGSEPTGTGSATTSAAATDRDSGDGASAGAVGAGLAEPGDTATEASPAEETAGTDEPPAAGTTVTAAGSTGSESAVGTEPAPASAASADESAAAPDEERAQEAADAGDEAEERDGAGDDDPLSLPDDDAERVALVAAAVESGDATPEHLDALVDALDADDEAVRRDAAAALGALAVEEPAVADDAVAALRDCQLDPEVEVSEAASAALDRAREAT